MDGGGPHLLHGDSHPPAHVHAQVYTAGTSGFLQILPIYLDHILFPNLRKEDFQTEVHHISGRGRSDASTKSRFPEVSRWRTFLCAGTPVWSTARSRAANTPHHLGRKQRGVRTIIHRNPLHTNSALHGVQCSAVHAVQRTNGINFKFYSIKMIMHFITILMKINENIVGLLKINS